MEIENDIKEKIKKRINPLLEKVNKIPGQTFRIPSKGLLYTDGELDEEVKDGELLVHPMTTLDEIYMKTPDMLFQGSAIEKVLLRTVPQIKKPLELYSNDIDYLLTCLRKISYGDYIPVVHRCDKCDEKNVQAQTYDIPLDYFLQNSKEISKDTLDNIQFTLSTGQVIILRPAKIREVLELYQVNDDETDPEKIEDLIVKSLSATIRSVDGVTDRDDISEWIKSLPRNVIEEFGGKIEKINSWGGTYRYTIECVDCGAEQVLENIVLNPIYFFIRPSNQKIK